MIGNAADARLALAQDAYDSDYFLGEGCTRTAYLINGVVYKVEYDFGANAHEYNNAILIRTLGVPDGYAIPDMTLYTVDGVDVLAMEYINGIATGECTDIICDLECSHDEKECLAPNALGSINAFEYDTSYGNIINRDDTLYLIDCG